MEHLEAYNRKLLANILPVHVAEHFLSVDKPVDVSFLIEVPPFFFFQNMSFYLQMIENK